MNESAQNLPDKERDIYIGVINRFIGYYSRLSQKHTQNDTSREYPFVAMDTRQVFEEIRLVHDFLEMDGKNKDKNFSFIDIGCGIGNILLIAEQFFFDVYGIEKDQYPFQLATELIGKDRVWQEDIWQYDDYDKFDVVYYFRPLPDAGPQTRFEHLVEDKIKKGAILIANRKMSDRVDHDPRFQKIASNYPIWQKIS